MIKKKVATLKEKQKSIFGKGNREQREAKLD